MESNERTLAIKYRYSLSEELISAISHGIGVGLAVTGLVLCIVKAISDNVSRGVVSACLYGSFTIILYLMSTLYHSLKPTCKGKDIFRIFDHCSIFLLILGTYIPYTLITLRGPIGWSIFGVILGTSILGIILNSISIEKFKKFSMICYLVMGWAVILAIKPLYLNLHFNGILFLVIGGVVYTIGAIIYGIGKKVKYMHSLWHFFVLGGTVLQFFSIYLYVL